MRGSPRGAVLDEGQSASAALAALQAGTGAANRLSTARRALLRILKRGLGTAAKRVARLEGDLERAGDADAWQHKGELLRGSFHLLKPGLSRVTVPDYTQDPPEQVEVELDPKAAAGDQVGLCFKRARKLRTAAERATETLPSERDVVSRIEAARSAAAEAADLPTLEQIAGELPGAVRAKAVGALRSLDANQPKRAQPKRVPWRSYRSADGWEIRVGKSAADSDELTLRGSKPHDLFLHVRAAPGAHVLVPTPRGKTVPKDTLLDAAELACLFSKRADAETNEVDYVERRYVRKPRGAKPGLVLLERSRTLSLRRDDIRRDRLRASRDPSPQD